MAKLLGEDREGELREGDDRDGEERDGDERLEGVWLWWLFGIGLGLVVFGRWVGMGRGAADGVIFGLLFGCCLCGVV